MSTTDQNQHVFPRKFKFFRVMLLGFNTKLAIPQRLTNHFIKENLTSVTLLSPLGKSAWNIRVSGNKEGLHFAEGWERFAADHRLSFGDLLVFKYVGGMVFHVNIFDKSTCEKDYYKITNSTGVAGRDHDHVPSQEENCDQLESHEYSCSLGKTNSTLHSSGQRSTPPVMEQETDKDETQVSSVRKADNYKHICKRGSRFMITISAKIKYTARIPVKFSRSNGLSSARQMLLRDPKGHPWPVNLLHYCKHSASGPDWSLLSAGWRDFLIGNKLKDGDVCVFELKNKSEMLVQIRRSCEDGSSARSKSPLQQVVGSNKRKATLQQKQKGSPSMVTRSISKPADHPAQFSSTIVPSNLYKKGNMNIPKAFLSLVDLSAEKDAVLVDPHSRRRWPVKICYPWKDGRCRMGGGWERFCDENNVQVGDVCVFSFKNHTKKREACTFQVEVIKSSKT